MSAEPFIKWAGGKRQLLPELRKHRPEMFRRYFEPFIGGAALFFDLEPTGGAILGDMNPHLVNAYEVVRDEVDALIHKLLQYKEQHCEEFYYDVRDVIFDGDDVTRAANFIYLNKTGYNGLYRVNRDGGYNVPFGRHKNPGIFEPDNLRACSQALQGVRVMANGFQVTVEQAERGDFVYFDPPYVPVGGEADFTSYTADGFTLQDQARLRDCALELKKRGVFVLLSNSDTPQVRQLYRHKDFGFEMRRIEAKRAINSSVDKRGPVGELLIW